MFECLLNQSQQTLRYISILVYFLGLLVLASVLVIAILYPCARWIGYLTLLTVICLVSICSPTVFIIQSTQLHLFLSLPMRGQHVNLRTISVNLVLFTIIKMHRAWPNRLTSANNGFLLFPTMAAIDPLEVPPFQLQSLLERIHPPPDLLDLGPSKNLSHYLICMSNFQKAERHQAPVLAVHLISSLESLVQQSQDLRQDRLRCRLKCAVHRLWVSDFATLITQRLSLVPGRDVYVGNSDGTIVRYTLQDGGTLDEVC